LTSRIFEPKTFYDLAIYIKDKLFQLFPQELKQATDRTCVSRAYYAIFLLFRDALLALPIRDGELRNRIKYTNDAHAIVAETIKIVDFNIGNYIVNLRRLRNQADYETNITFPPSEVAYAFKIANEIISKMTIIASKIKESDIILAWNEIQRRRLKKYPFY
jgi:uncharacterized protein (UPF0332 family)